MKHFSLKRLAALTSAAALMGSMIYATKIEPGWLRVRYIPVKLPRLPRAFHDYRIAHISDIHMGGWMTRQRLLETVQIINQIHPDSVAITGDFVDRVAGTIADDLIVPLSKLKPNDVTVAVPGNHDYQYGINGVRRLLKASGVIDLSNTIHTLERGDARLHLAGVDDVIERAYRLDAVLDLLPAEGPAVLLAHEPDFANVVAATERFDLQLSGHTHGGQVRLPFVGAPKLPSYGIHYPSGRYQIGDMMLYTNHGLGMIWPYIRFNSRPELTILILESD